MGESRGGCHVSLPWVSSLRLLHIFTTVAAAKKAATDVAGRLRELASDCIPGCLVGRIDTAVRGDRLADLGDDGSVDGVPDVTTIYQDGVAAALDSVDREIRTGGIEPRLRVSAQGCLLRQMRMKIQRTAAKEWLPTPVKQNYYTTFMLILQCIGLVLAKLEICCEIDTF